MDDNQFTEDLAPHVMQVFGRDGREAGIVYATDAAISKKVKVVAEISEKLTGPVRYPLALLKHSEGREPAQLFYRHLTSPAATKVFQKYGFTVVSVAP